MNPNKLKRLFPNASPDFIKRNQDHAEDPGVSGQSKPVVGEEVCQAQRDSEVGAEYELCHIDVIFWAAHGKCLDSDNREYAVKPIQDACINLGLASDDSHITSKTTQWMDRDNPGIQKKE